MTFGDVDQQNEHALQTQDRIDNDPDVQEPLDEPRPYMVSDRDALWNAEQHEIQVKYKW